MTLSYVNLIISFIFLFSGISFSFPQLWRSPRNFHLKEIQVSSGSLNRLTRNFIGGECCVFNLICALNSQLMYLGTLMYAFTRRHL